MPNAANVRINRRLEARVACQLAVRYSYSGREWHPATVIDLTSFGCRLRLGEALARGQALAVVFQEPGSNGQGALEVEVRGRVIWSRSEGLSCQAGIQFDDESTAIADLQGRLASSHR